MLITSNFTCGQGSCACSLSSTWLIYLHFSVLSQRLRLEEQQQKTTLLAFILNVYVFRKSAVSIMVMNWMYWLHVSNMNCLSKPLFSYVIMLKIIPCENYDDEIIEGYELQNFHLLYIHRCACNESPCFLLMLSFFFSLSLFLFFCFSFLLDAWALSGFSSLPDLLGS